MDAKARNSADASRELIIRRTFDAPRAMVFRAWTEPQLLAQWSCPRGFTFTEQTGDLRVGGGFFARMRSPEGTEHRLRGKPLREASEWLERYREFWEQSLDRLVDLLEKGSKR